jgi:hypothetical protein
MSTINKIIGYGILTFSIGFFLGSLWIEYLRFLIPVGSLTTFLGVFYFFKYADLDEQFRKDPNDDVLTYFWDTIALKVWTLIFVLWMIVMNVTLIFGWTVYVL